MRSAQMFRPLKSQPDSGKLLQHFHAHRIQGGDVTFELDEMPVIRGHLPKGIGGQTVFVNASGIIQDDGIVFPRMGTRIWRRSRDNPSNLVTY